MGKVFLNVFGDGYAYCVPPAGEEMVNNEPFTVHFIPDGGASLDAVRAYDSHDYAVALPPVVNNQITMNFRTGWGSIYFEIYFSGSPTPPTPPNILVWLLMKMAWKKRHKI